MTSQRRWAFHIPERKARESEFREATISQRNSLSFLEGSGLSRADRLFSDPGKSIGVIFQENPCLGKSQDKFVDMPVMKQMEMDPPAFLPKPLPSPTTARLDLDGRADTNSQDASVITDNIVARRKHLFLLSTTPFEPMDA
jgi:hypothetical protein